MAYNLPTIGQRGWGQVLNTLLTALVNGKAETNHTHNGSGLPSTMQPKTGNYTAAVGDFVIGDATGGGFTVTLPDANTGELVAVKKADASANAITVVGQGGDTIDGDADATIIEKNAGAIFIRDGSNWLIAAITSYGSGGGADTGAAPDALTGAPVLEAWYKADALALANGAAVASWPDSSGNARDLGQATGGKQPVYVAADPLLGGQPAVRFDGTDDCLFKTATAIASGSAFTLVAVVYRQVESAGVGSGSGCIFDGRGTAFLGLTTDYSAPSSVTLRAGNPTGTISYQANIAGAFIYLLTYDGAETVGFEEAKARKRGTTLTGAIQPTTINVGANDASTGGNTFFPGDIAEVCLYSDVLTAEQRKQLLRHLTSKYGFAAVAASAA
jgi:hypothetical protein